MVSRRKLATSLGIVAVAAISLLAANLASAKSSALPRSETLITSGTQWGNIPGMNPYVNNAPGMVGFVNETLLRYDPLKDKYINWLASSAKFTSAKVFVIKVRSDVKWSNGDSFKGSDVAFNLNLGRFKTAFWNTLYKNIKPPSVSGNTVTIKFKGTPNYARWQNLIWNLPIVNPTQYKAITEADFTTFSPSNPVGTGPYELHSLDAATQVVWQKKSSWWAAKAGVSPAAAPTYIIDLVNTSNTNALSGLLTGIEDLNNNYIVGINKYVSNGQMQTYYPKKPYNLAANTAWLTPNVTHKPLNDPKFRRALAMSINVNNIVNNDYHNLVEPANATGLLKIWNKWVDKKQLKKFGFKYSTSGAKKLLKSAGYKTKGGYVVNKNGKPINLKISVPAGWSDWETAEAMIVTSAKKAGIHLTIDAGDYGHWQLFRNTGKFDLIIDNTYQMSDNPFTYFSALFSRPILKTQTFANFSRYNNVAAWRLVKKLDNTPLGQTKQRMAIMKKLEKVVLTDLPLIPMWYNGVWAQMQSKYWTNWPSSTSSRNYLPCMWGGYRQMTGIDTFTHVKKA